VPLLYSGFAPLGNGSVVPILLKTKALDVLERFARTPLSNSGFVSALAPETRVHVGFHLIHCADTSQVVLRQFRFQIQEGKRSVSRDQPGKLRQHSKWCSYGIDSFAKLLNL